MGKKISTIIARRRFAAALALALGLCGASPAVFGADGSNDGTVRLRVLAWNRTVEGLKLRTNEGWAPLRAPRGRISPTYAVPRREDGALRLHEKNSTLEEPAVAFETSVPPGAKEVLLLLRNGKKGYEGKLMPFSESDFPYNSITVFNQTTFPMAVEIDGERHSLEKGSLIRVPYSEEDLEQEALRSRMAAKTESDWKIVQNGFITLQPDARILYFISDDFASEQAARESPVRFTYVTDRMRGEDERRFLSEIEYEALEAEESREPLSPEEYETE